MPLGPSAQQAGELASRSRQTAHMIAMRVRTGTGGEFGDTSLAKCPAGDCTADRHRELVLLLWVTCLGMISYLSEEGHGRAAIAMMSCEGASPDQIRAVLAAHQLMACPGADRVRFIDRLDADGLRFTTSGLIECAAGLAVEVYGPAEAEAQLVAGAERMTGALVAKEAPGYLLTRTWSTAGAMS